MTTVIHTGFYTEFLFIGLSVPWPQILYVYHSTFPLIDISWTWSQLGVFVTWHLQSTVITQRFEYTAFQTPGKTLYSSFIGLILDVSRLRL